MLSLTTQSPMIREKTNPFFSGKKKLNVAYATANLIMHCIQKEAWHKHYEYD